MKLKTFALIGTMMLMAMPLMAQSPAQTGPVSSGFLSDPIYVPSLAQQLRDGTFVYADAEEEREARPKKQFGNNVIPGKGSMGEDPVLQTTGPLYAGSPPSLIFDANTGVGVVSDPTGAVGPDHFMAGWNFAFRIYDKDGNPLTPISAWSSIFPGNNIGDGVILFDQYADNGPGEPRGRFVITEFDSNPNGFNVAVCQGPDPVNDGWHVYTAGFGTGQFPDYTKFSVWPDGYYCTANIGSRRIFAVEREKMIDGESAQFVSLPLTGIATSGFYSPQGFQATGGSEPEPGNFSIAYLQDDAWGGVSDDHIKIWTVNVDWDDTSNSTISAPQEIVTADFISVFDGGSFANLEQPAGPDIDALQATVMNQAHVRKFCDYNSAIFNFVVDTDPGGGELAGVRWYELRQTAQGEPWTIFQEGTYIAPDGRDAFSASMAMDIQGNIGMGYTSVSNSEMISIRYTGRLAGDPLGDMTVAEQLIGQSTANSSTTRMADYVHLTIDPNDDRTFWHIAEYWNSNRRNVVGVFDLGNTLPGNDVAIIDIMPNEGPLTSTEDITVTIQNYGTTTVTSVPVTYSIDGDTPVSETYTGSIPAGGTDTYTFSQQADLSLVDHLYRIETTNSLAGDEVPFNDCYGENLFTGDVLSVGDLALENAELQVVSADNNIFDITLRTNHNGILPISVYDITGKILVFNNLANEGGKYKYQLDMSYVSAGVYLVKLGRGNLTKSTKIIVK
ncbi:MAG: T9SS type A sorting domain-containing protein [Bacteroidota bacterium]